MKSELVFWNVDTQRDFMNTNGALYVADADLIKPNLQQITQYAHQNKIKIMGSVDAHKEKDAELSANGGPFPQHCMVGSFGQKHIEETFPENAVYVPNMKLVNGKLDEFVMHGGEVFMEKQHYDVFTNPNTEELLRKLGVKTAVVYGVATDYCDRAAALGFRKMGIDVFLVEDAIKAVTEQGGKDALKEMHRAGVKKITTADVLAGAFYQK